MNSHELAKKLLELPDKPVRLYTDHGQTSSEAIQVDEFIYSYDGDYCCPEDDIDPEDRQEDTIDVIEIYGE